MSRCLALLLTLLIALTTILSACAPTASAPVQPAAATAAAEPAKAIEPAAAPLSNADPTKLILATTTSTS